MMRLDQALVLRGLVSTRSKAQLLIEAGNVQVKIQDKCLTKVKASIMVSEEAKIEITNYSPIKYVSRGGLKIESVAETFGISFLDRLVLDCGQSTGGFTDFALQKGARFVIGIEVGIDQLDLSLKGNPRVKTFEKLNVLEAYEKVPSEYLNDGAVDIAIADVSFVSLLHVLPGILKFKPLEMLLLIKPQFELSKKDLSKSGLVKDKGLAHRRVLDVANTIGQKSDLQLIDTIPSPILGSDGNQEYFAYFKDPQK